MVDATKIDYPENLVIEPLDELVPTNEVLSQNEKPKDPMRHSHLDEENEEKDLVELDELDKIDVAIIEILSENASVSFRKIAKKVGVSTQLVIKRYKQMQKNVLPFSAITVNLKKLGYKGIALFSVKTSNTHKTSKVYDEIVQIPNIIVAHKCVGAIDMYLVAPFSNVKQLIEVKQNLCNTPGVKDIELFIDEPFSSWPLNLFAQHYFQTKAEPKKN